MRRKRTIYRLFLIFWLLTAILPFIPEQKASAATDDGYYIQNMDINVAALPDRSFRITETIDVYFKEERHGINRNIPTYSSLEKEVRIQDVNVTGAPFTNNNGNIRIGDPDKTITGRQQYVISYTLWHYADTEPDADYLYLNLIGTEWDTYIENFTATVTLPTKDIKKCTLTGGYSGNRENDVCSYEINDDTISIKGIRKLKAHEGVTINVAMPEGTFYDALVWKPAIHFHSITENIAMDEYGEVTVDKTYDATINSEYSYNFDIDDMVENRLNKVYDIEITLPSGEVTTPFVYNYVDLKDYVGQRVTFGIRYKEKFKLSSNTNELNLISGIYYDRSEFEPGSITVNYQMPYRVDKVSVTHAKTAYYYGIYKDDEYQLTQKSKSGTFKINADKEAYESVYLNFHMPEAKFLRHANSFDFIIPCIGIVVLALLIILVLIKKKPFNPVPAFYPPDGLNPAEMGYIIDSEVSGRDIVSLIYYWASKGLLTISFTKNKDFTLKKTGEITCPPFKTYERTLFNSIFNLGRMNTVHKKDLTNKLYTHVNKSSDKVRKFYTKEHPIMDRISKGKASLLGHLLPFAYILFILAADASLGFSPINTAMLMFVCFLISCLMYSVVFGYVKKRYRAGNHIFTFIVLAAFVVIQYLVYKPIISGYALSNLSAFITFVCLTGMVLVSPFLCHLSKEGNELMEKTVGFLLFLKTAEKDRLRLLLDENPDYFYDILPYAQVLGVSKQWIQRFDGLTMEPPEWMDGYTSRDYTMTLLTSLSNDMSNTMTSSPSSSGDSSGGGSFSDGGSSGGGSGGGGGSSW